MQQLRESSVDPDRKEMASPCFLVTGHEDLSHHGRVGTSPTAPTPAQWSRPQAYPLKNVALLWMGLTKSIPFTDIWVSRLTNFSRRHPTRNGPIPSQKSAGKEISFDPRFPPSVNTSGPRREGQNATRLFCARLVPVTPRREHFCSHRKPPPKVTPHTRPIKRKYL